MIKKKIRYAIFSFLLGVLYTNIACLLEEIGTMADCGAIGMIGMPLVMCALTYFLYIRTGMSLYSLLCIPGMLISIYVCTAFWAKIFNYTNDNCTFYTGGVVVILYFSLYVCVIFSLIVLLIRGIISWIRDNRTT